jgi:hypothetical protein
VTDLITLSWAELIIEPVSCKFYFAIPVDTDPYCFIEPIAATVLCVDE